MSDRQNTQTPADPRVAEIANGLIKHVNYPTNEAWKAARELVAEADVHRK